MIFQIAFERLIMKKHLNQQEINKFRESISKENLIELDFQYLQKSVDTWWSENECKFSTQTLKIKLQNLLINEIASNDFYFFDKVGLRNHHICGVRISNVFSVNSPLLALIAHEALSDLFYIVDIKYDYEEHKALYLKSMDESQREWGNGYGDISPHSDDLYENLNIDYLSLTVSRDITKTPTLYYKPKDIINKMTDSEVALLLEAKAEFFSGKNVDGRKSRVRNVIDYTNENGYLFSMDFRIETGDNKRMLPTNESCELIIDKVRNIVSNCTPIKSFSNTGTFLILSNRKVLHARSPLQMNVNEIKTAPGSSISYENAPRLLYRSKGQRRNYFM